MNQITRLFSERLSQLSFDAKREEYFGDHKDHWTQKVKFMSDGTIITPDQYQLHVDSRNLPRGRGINELSMTQDEVLVGLGCTIQKPVSYHLERGVGLWYLVDREHGMGDIPTMVDFTEMKQYIRPDRPLSIPIGYSAGRRPMIINMDNPTTAHFIVAGTTGGGKSSILHTMICVLAQLPPEDIKFSFFDFKRGELRPFYKGLPNLMHEIVVEPDQFKDYIGQIAAISSERYKLFGETSNIKTYNASVGKDRRLPRILVVVDELGLVMEDEMFSAKERKGLVRSIARIASTGRACGIHLVLSTQRPCAQVLPGLIRQCCNGRIAFACASTSESIIIINNGDAAFKRAVPAGRAILGYSRFHIEFQAAYISEEERRALCGDVVAGRYEHTRKMLHDVTIEELARYSLENFGGQLKKRLLYNTFKERGITQTQLDDLAEIYTTEPFMIGEEQFILKNPTNGFRQAKQIVPYVVN